MSRKIFSPRIIIIALIVFLSACGGATSATEPASSSTQPVIAPTQGAITPTAAPTVIVTAQPEIPERRLLTLEFPPKIRAGDSDIVRLTLQVDQSGNITPTAAVGGNVITGEVIEIPNLYETHHVIAEARIDMAGVQVTPPDMSHQTLSPGQTVMFAWSIRPEQVGIYRGTVWLFLRFVDKVSGDDAQKAVSAQSVEIDAVNFFGISARVVRIVGGFGSIVGAVVGFPFFEDIVKFIYSRRRKKSKS